MHNLITKEGFDYGFDPSGCEACGGRCCTGESGNIWVSVKEMELIAEALNLAFDEFTRSYVKKVWYKYSLIEQKIDEQNHACIFFDTQSKGCAIYEQRPRQCRDFPFWDVFKNNLEEVKKECPSIIFL